MVQLYIPRVYHHFIGGPDGKIVRNIMELIGSRMEIPSQYDNSNHIHILGGKNGVLTAKEAILRIFREKVTCHFFQLLLRALGNSKVQCWHIAIFLPGISSSTAKQWDLNFCS